jgi:hypothetical protein
MMKKRKWTEEEINFLKRNYTSKSIQELSHILNRTGRSIRMYANSQLKLQKYPEPKEGHLFCSTCKKEKQQNEFHKNSNTHFSGRGYVYSCKNCVQLQLKETKEKNPLAVWARRTIENHKKKYKVLINKDKLIKLTESIKQCPFCQSFISYKNDKISNNSATIDRLDNGNTLTLDNITICCYQCNSTKRNRTLKEFADYMEKALPLVRSFLSVR